MRHADQPTKGRGQQRQGTTSTSMTTRQASEMTRKHEFAPVAISCLFALGYDRNNGQPECGGRVI